MRGTTPWSRATIDNLKDLAGTELQKRLRLFRSLILPVFGKIAKYGVFVGNLYLILALFPKSLSLACTPRYTIFPTVTLHGIFMWNGGCTKTGAWSFSSKILTITKVLAKLPEVPESFLR